MICHFQSYQAKDHCSAIINPQMNRNRKETSEYQPNKKIISIEELIPFFINWQREQPSKKQPHFIHISGASGAGKTTCSRLLADTKPDSQILYMDDFMRGKRYVELILKEDPNCYGWDDPRNFNLESIVKGLDLLSSGVSLVTPVFNRVLSEADPKETREVVPKQGGIIIVEGIHSLSAPIARFADLKIFVDADLHERLWRRAVRNTLFPGYGTKDLDSLLNNYLLRVDPSYIKHVRPLKGRADLVIQNQGNPILEFSRVLEDKPIFESEHLVFARLLPKDGTGSLKPSEEILLTRDGDGCVIHYVINRRELLRHSLTSTTLELIQRFYDLQE